MSLFFTENALVNSRVHAYQNGLQEYSDYSEGTLFALIAFVVTAFIVFFVRKTEIRRQVPSDEIVGKEDWKTLVSAAGYKYENRQDIF